MHPVHGRQSLRGMPSYVSRERSCAYEDPALVCMPTASDRKLDSVLKLDATREREDAPLHLARVHTAHYHLVVSKVKTLGNISEVVLVEDTAEHEDVARVLATEGDRSADMIRSVAKDVLNTVLQLGWHYLVFHKCFQELLGHIDSMLQDLHASASAPCPHHYVQLALAKSTANVKEVAVAVEAHGLYNSELLTLDRLVTGSEGELTRAKLLEHLDHLAYAPLRRLSIAQTGPAAEYSLVWNLKVTVSLRLSCPELSALTVPGSVLEAPGVGQVVHSPDGLGITKHQVVLLYLTTRASRLQLLHEYSALDSPPCI